MANDLESQSGLRVQPTIAIGLLLYAGYLAIFCATWAINDVDYDNTGNTVESTKLHYAYPTLFGSAFLVVALTGLGWRRIALFDKQRSGPVWAWIGPIAMVLVAAGSFATTNGDQVTGQLAVWSVLGATDADSFAGAILFYPVAIVVTVAVIRRNRGLRLG